MDIFETLKKSIRVSIEKLQRDPSLAEIIQAVNDYQAGRMGRIDV